VQTGASFGLRVALGVRIVACAAVLTLAGFVFVRSLSPQEPVQARTGDRAPVTQHVSVVKVPAQARIYYYVVSSEQQKKQVLDERMAAVDYYGVGYPTTQPIILVARTQEIFDSLEDMMVKTTLAGGPPYTLIDMR
jgi:hypothetical protein